MKNTTKKQTIFFYVIAFFMLTITFFVSCVTPIDFSGKTTDNYLVLSGKITNHKGIHEFRLMRSNSFDTSFVFEKGAIITISDNTGLKEQLIEDIDQNKYILYGNIIKGVPGKTYTLEIAQKGKTYKSLPETMPISKKPDSLSIKFDEQTKINAYGSAEKEFVAKVQVYTPLISNKATWLRWQSDAAFSKAEIPHGPFNSFKTCYFTQTINPQFIPVYTNQNSVAATHRLDNYNIANEVIVDYRFEERHYFNAYQLSISKEAYDYWQKINIVSNPSETIFNTIPAAVRGNIHNTTDEKELVLGYFEAASVDTIRAFVTPDALAGTHNVANSCNRYPMPRYCTECTLLQSNYQLKTPYYWGK